MDTNTKRRLRRVRPTAFAWTWEAGIVAAAALVAGALAVAIAAL